MIVKESATWLSVLNREEILARQQQKGVVSSTRNSTPGLSRLEVGSANEYDVNEDCLSPNDEITEEFEPYQSKNSEHSSYNPARREDNESDELEVGFAAVQDEDERWQRKRSFEQAFVQEKHVFKSMFERCPHRDWRTAFSTKEQSDVHQVNCPFNPDIHGAPKLKTRSVGSHSQQSFHPPPANAADVMSLAQAVGPELVGKIVPAPYIPNPFLPQEMRSQRSPRVRDSTWSWRNAVLTNEHQQDGIATQDMGLPSTEHYGSEKSDPASGENLFGGGQGFSDPTGVHPTVVGGITENHKGGASALEHSFAPEGPTDFDFRLEPFTDDLVIGMNMPSLPLQDIDLGNEPDFWYFGA